MQHGAVLLSWLQDDDQLPVREWPICVPVRHQFARFFIASGWPICFASPSELAGPLWPPLCPFDLQQIIHRKRHQMDSRQPLRLAGAKQQASARCNSQTEMQIYHCLLHSFAPSSRRPKKGPRRTRTRIPEAFVVTLWAACAHCNAASSVCSTALAKLAPALSFDRDRQTNHLHDHQGRHIPPSGHSQSRTVARHCLWRTHEHTHMGAHTRSEPTSAHLCSLACLHLHCVLQMARLQLGAPLQL